MLALPVVLAPIGIGALHIGFGLLWPVEYSPRFGIGLVLAPISLALIVAGMWGSSVAKIHRARISAAGLLGLVVSAFSLYPRVSYEAAFWATERYSYVDNLIARTANASEEDKSGPYIRGRILVIGARSKSLDYLTFSLPEDERAATPSEVETLIVVKRDTFTVGRYGNGGEARRQYIDLTIIDPVDKRVIGRRSFFGEAPPDAIRRQPGQGGATGDDVDQREILRWLSSLPRR